MQYFSPRCEIFFNFLSPLPLPLLPLSILARPTKPLPSLPCLGGERRDIHLKHIPQNKHNLELYLNLHTFFKKGLSFAFHGALSVNPSLGCCNNSKREEGRRKAMGKGEREREREEGLKKRLCLLLLLLSFLLLRRHNAVYFSWKEKESAL